MIKKELIRKIVLFAFLTMIIIGFTVPIFLNQIPTENQVITEPRLCQSDKDCYLFCDDQPVSILCSKNLCQQNSCTEQSLYSYAQQPTTFTLKISLNNTEISLLNFTNSNDYFVKFDQNKVRTFSSLTLSHVLEKVKIELDNNCLTIHKVSYCSNNQKNITMYVNDKESYNYGDYIPHEGDKIEIIYS